MKTVTTWSLYLLISLFILSFSACNPSARNNRAQSSSIEGSSRTNEQRVMEMHDKLMRSFGDDWIERESDPELYPPFYGGSFIDNNGTFVIAVTGNQEANKQHLIDVLGTDNFNVETVQYSYRQMMQVMDLIDAFLFNTSVPNDHPVLERFAGAYPDVMDNRVKVILTDVNQEAICAFKRDISDSPIVEFEQGEMPELF